MKKMLWEFFLMEENTTKQWHSAICHQYGIFMKRNGASPTGMKQYLKHEDKDAQKKYLQILKDGKIEQVTFLYNTLLQIHSLDHYQLVQSIKTGW